MFKRSVEDRIAKELEAVTLAANNLVNIKDEMESKADACGDIITAALEKQSKHISAAKKASSAALTLKELSLS